MTLPLAVWPQRWALGNRIGQAEWRSDKAIVGDHSRSEKAIAGQHSGAWRTCLASDEVRNARTVALLLLLASEQPAYGTGWNSRHGGHFSRHDFFGCTGREVGSHAS